MFTEAAKVEDIPVLQEEKEQQQVKERDLTALRSIEMLIENIIDREARLLIARAQIDMMTDSGDEEDDDD